jgi:hypothetical protein
MQIKGNEVVTGLSGTNTTNATMDSTADTPSKKIRFEMQQNKLLGNKKSSIDVSALLEKI